MKIIKGLYNEAYIYTDIVEETALDQIKSMCDQEILKDSKIRVMPDVHAGNGCTIGTTMTIHDAIVPYYVGVDIGCGLEVVKLKERELDLRKLDEVIYAFVPSGFSVRSSLHPYNDMIDLTQLKCFGSITYQRAQLSLGTLGGGNHFIEADRDDEGSIYLVIHSGSRMLGKQVADYYQYQAYLMLNHLTDQDKQKLIDRLKSEGREKDIQTELLKFLNQEVKISHDQAYVQKTLLEDYLYDMAIVQKFAVLNRKAMMDVILQKMNLTVDEQFSTIHNYIDIEHKILRKGAVSARKGEKLIIPINMKDGSLICIGKGNDEWNQSAPHGAERLMSRREAIDSIDLEDFKKEMEGIYSTSVSQKTIDESPMAYKSIEDILAYIGETVEVVKIIEPIYNYKAQ